LEISDGHIFQTRQNIKVPALPTVLDFLFGIVQPKASLTSALAIGDWTNRLGARHFHKFGGNNRVDIGDGCLR
jgi:hypothetical protein